MLTFYWYPNCGTCKQAKKWLDQNEVEYQAVHIVDSPPTKEELKDILNKSGLEIKKLFNTSGKKYRELNLKEKLKDASDDEKLTYLTSDGMLIKRPIVVGDNQATVGFKEEVFANTWK
ncbi:arsenate reductase family protein [Saliterribacillus persicus]|uniref:Arsenate reductase n=1 Tax=Saliterribacillus persicus TaxID=930114 RepID=A0A368XG58_9BACI|nr:arsenate reductase family protein [Saliterribacillus persicus]RCW66981.1 arsenate reductase [Saliterribacillus persicus]